MTKAHWADLTGMPLHIRLLCMAAGVARHGVATMKPRWEIVDTLRNWLS